MLVLRRKWKESIQIGDNTHPPIITIKILSCSKSSVTLGIEAPDDVIVLREEIINRLRFEMKTADAARQENTAAWRKNNNEN